MPMLRIVSWNILAPELMKFYWRSSYGLPLLSGVRPYDAVTASRMSNIATILRGLRPDILMLQETTNASYACLGGRSITAYLSQELGLAIAGESFKGSKFFSGEPPHEQTRAVCVDSGVATLFSAARVDHTRTISRGEDGGPCALFSSGIGSPFTADEFRERTAANDGGSALPFTVVNIHIRMQYPHISGPLKDVVLRLQSKGVLVNAEGARRVVFGGDLNSGSAKSAADLAATIPKGLSDISSATGETAPADDHLFCGEDVQAVNVTAPVPVLEMNHRSDVVNAKWTTADVTYTLHPGNKELLESGSLLSDHPFVAIDMIA